MARRITAEEFETEVLNSTRPVIVDFYSDSCAPCKMISPVLADIEEGYADRLSIVKVNIAYEAELVQKYEILAAPTLVFFKDGEEADRVRGFAGKEALAEKINRLL